MTGLFWSLVTCWVFQGSVVGLSRINCQVFTGHCRSDKHQLQVCLRSNVGGRQLSLVICRSVKCQLICLSGGQLLCSSGVQLLGLSTYWYVCHNANQPITELGLPQARRPFFKKTFHTTKIKLTFLHIVRLPFDENP